MQGRQRYFVPLRSIAIRSALLDGLESVGNATIPPNASSRGDHGLNERMVLIKGQTGRDEGGPET